jgi:hypothetical protein
MPAITQARAILAARRRTQEVAARVLFLAAFFLAAVLPPLRLAVLSAAATSCLSAFVLPNFALVALNVLPPWNSLMLLLIVFRLLPFFIGMVQPLQFDLKILQERADKKWPDLVWPLCGKPFSGPALNLAAIQLFHFIFTFLAAR